MILTALRLYPANFVPLRNGFVASKDVPDLGKNDSMLCTPCIYPFTTPHHKTKKYKELNSLPIIPVLGVEVGHILPELSRFYREFCFSGLG
jgi:hypothetical protein